MTSSETFQPEFFLKKKLTIPDVRLNSSPWNCSLSAAFFFFILYSREFVIMLYIFNCFICKSVVVTCWLINVGECSELLFQTLINEQIKFEKLHKTILFSFNGLVLNIMLWLFVNLYFLKTTWPDLKFWHWENRHLLFMAVKLWRTFYQRIER